MTLSESKRIRIQAHALRPIRWAAELTYWGHRIMKKAKGKGGKGKGKGC